MANVIFVAGYPGTGKSYFCRWIKKEYPDFKLISPDEIKEAIWDKFGFDNDKEKAELTDKSWAEFYQVVEESMKNGGNILLDYPFSEKQRPRMQKFIEEFKYTALTIRLVSDFETLYERQLARDEDNTRHLGHIMTHYHLGDVLEDRTKADALVDHEEFFDRCKNRGYGDFSLGDLFEIDVTSFDAIPYDKLKDFLKIHLTKK